MKKRLLSIVLCMVLLFCACSKEPTKEEIRAEYESVLEEINPVDPSYAYQKNIGTWLTPETEYHYDENWDAEEDTGDRLYLRIGKPTKTHLGADYMVYIDLKTGEKHDICPDPLCEHTRDVGCPYVNFFMMQISPYSYNLIYANTMTYMEDTSQFVSMIYKIDLDNNRITPIFDARTLVPNLTEDFTQLRFTVGDKLYFEDAITCKEENKEDGTLTETVKNYFLSISWTDGTVEVLDDNFDGSISYCRRVDDRLVFMDRDKAELYTTDLNFEDKEFLFAFPEGESSRGTAYDRGELYVLSGFYTIRDLSLTKGTLYRKNMDKDGEWEKVSFPTDAPILDFCLTRDYIYYTKFDPIIYGETPSGLPCMKGHGNKIYRIPRHGEEPPVEELVFDGHGEIFFTFYFNVIGDYLYLDHCNLVEMGSYKQFKSYGSIVRINMKENTIKWINVD